MTTTQTRRLVVAINPNAAFGMGRDIAPDALAALGAKGYTTVPLTAASFDALRDAVAAELSSGADALVVVGGDGMVSLGANLLAGTATPLGIIPSGTGNDTARGLGIPVGNTEAAVRMLVAALEHGPRQIDLGHVTLADGVTRWYVGVLSAGFDAIVNERANRLTWPRGPRRYTLAIIWELLRFRPIAYRLDADGVVSHPRAMLAAVANGTSFGGGMMITPGARFDDGELDLFLVGPMSKLQFLRLFPSVYMGEHVTDPAVTITPVRRIRLEADGAVAYADGERMGALPLEVKVVPAALRVLAPLL